MSLILGMAFAAALYAGDVIGAPVLVGLALTTTALGALVPILRDAGLTEHRVRPASSSRRGAAGEFCPIVALSIVLAIASGDPWRTALLLVFAVIAVGAGLLTTRARPARVVRLIEADHALERPARAPARAAAARRARRGRRARSGSTSCSARSRPASSSG